MKTCSSTMATKKNILLKKHIRPNQKWQRIIGATFLPILILGYFFSWIGFAVVACMFAGLLMSRKKGRKWCDFLCPRGSFLDEYVARISPQKPLPTWFYSYKFRLTFIGILFSFLTFNIIMAWPNVDKIAFSFVKTITITTVLSIFFAFIYRARAWCVVCPVGTFSGLLGGKKMPLKIDYGKCLNCTNCEVVCPIGLSPYKDKHHTKLQSRDCLKCGTCIANCPSQALSFSKK